MNYDDIYKIIELIANIVTIVGIFFGVNYVKKIYNKIEVKIKIQKQITNFMYQNTNYEDKQYAQNINNQYINNLTIH